MGYRALRECVEDLERRDNSCGSSSRLIQTWKLPRFSARVRGRRTRPLLRQHQGCRFPMVGNLFGTIRQRLFRDSLEMLARLVSLSVDRPTWSAGAVVLEPEDAGGRVARPKKVRRGPVLAVETTLDQLPQLRSWPDDSGCYTAELHGRLTLRPGPFESGHVHPDFRWPLRAEQQAGIRLVHRKSAPCGGDPPRAVAAECLRRRPAGDDRGRRDAVARGGQQLAFAGLLGRRRVPMVCLPPAADSRRGRLALPATSNQRCYPKRVLEPPGLLQHGPRFPGDAGGAGLPPASPDLALTVVGRPRRRTASSTS